MADEAVPFCVEVYLYFLSFSHSKHKFTASAPDKWGLFLSPGIRISRVW